MPPVNIWVALVMVIVAVTEKIFQANIVKSCRGSGNLFHVYLP